jgi:cyanophycin synthetase
LKKNRYQHFGWNKVSAMAIAYVLDSRRLTGASMLLDRPGAILEVAPPASIKTLARVHWRRLVRKLMNNLGWAGEAIADADHGPVQMLAITAPVDLLLVATYVTEWAWQAALDVVEDSKTKRATSTTDDRVRAETLADVSIDLLSHCANNANPKLAALYRAAKAKSVITLLAETDLSLGEGAGAKCFAYDDLPLPDEIAWHPKRRRIPIALVTGTNGKTTTVRLLARLLANEHVPDPTTPSVTHKTAVGFCSTDFVQIGDTILQRDDYSGPTGARIVLRHPDTEAAVLEIARGGMLRRGIQVSDADVGILTNVAPDHLGENGIFTLNHLADAKLTITRGLAPRAPIVINADDVHCRARARLLSRPVFWFALQKPKPALIRCKKLAGLIYLEQHHVVLEQAGVSQPLIDVRDCPITLNGSALFNVANLLAAVAAALVLKVPIASIQASLRLFGREPTDNPGRMNCYAINGATVITDYAHNTDGVCAALSAVARMPKKRLWIGTGLPGDRSLETGQEVAQLVAQTKPHQVIVKELKDYLRGRPEREMSDTIINALLAHGVRKSQVSYRLTDREMVEHVLKVLAPGDVAMLFLHEEQQALSALLHAASVANGTT